jgi:uridylate kinase
MRIVLRIGGSVIASPINPELIIQYTELLRTLKMQRHDIAVVVGGGKMARMFIEAAKSLGLGEKNQDEVAISVSRIFAQLFSRKIGDLGCGNVPETVDDAAHCLGKGKIVVMGGLVPGMTTDAVAGLIAQEVKADVLIKATDQEGVYDKDPRKNPKAVKLEHLKFEDLSRVLVEEKHRAGINQVIDPEAVKVLRRHRIRVVVVNGFRPENVLLAVEGKHVGTLID